MVVQCWGRIPNESYVVELLCCSYFPKERLGTVPGNFHPDDVHKARKKQANSRRRGEANPYTVSKSEVGSRLLTPVRLTGGFLA